MTNETFQRGEWVEVYDNRFLTGWFRRIYVGRIDGAAFPIVTVSVDDESCFVSGENFRTSQYRAVRKISQPKQPKKTVKIMIAMPHS